MFLQPPNQTAKTEAHRMSTTHAHSPNTVQGMCQARASIHVVIGLELWSKIFLQIYVLGPLRNGPS